ncbi:UbiD family decarboxylase [Pelagibacterium flavum]|uniref:UbiD family decarboxylase n=1 Tax=Pelagibacterium flavum TaxID=2984530 RepID=A0ABY6IKR1_9HYPH|nr:UbiD family decarboxylase [Pelagibacterium sp. YIM 151497]UYQ71176.1 UbiD family decarboxylase [Pelagibacterium sp. YIM 151497]
MPNLPIARDLKQFLALLEARGDLVRVNQPVSVVHEITEIHRRVLEKDGPALLFERPTDQEGREYSIPLVTNVFGTVDRVALALGCTVDGLDGLGQNLAALNRPKPPESFDDAVAKIPLARAALTMGIRPATWPRGRHKVLRGNDIDLSLLPIQWCWSGEPAPLITWPLVITRDPHDASDINVGVYRMQVVSADSLIVRWLGNRGGARHFRAWQALGENMPIAIVVGADPAVMLSAVMPIPDGMNELRFSGLLRRRRCGVMKGKTQDLPIPQSAEIVLEGRVSISEELDEGPFGDHTGYYNSVARFPKVVLSSMALPEKPIYMSTFTGRPPDEPSRIGVALNALFVPLIKTSFPEIEDLWLPPEACSYRAMIVSVKKRYAGQARRVMMGLWSVLPQFSYCKLMVVVDDDIDVRSWEDVIWAISTRFEAPRDLFLTENTPMDYLDFSTARQGLGTKVGFDATNKIGSETDREWGKPLKMSESVRKRVDDIWMDLGIPR